MDYAADMLSAQTADAELMEALRCVEKVITVEPGPSEARTWRAGTRAIWTDAAT